MAQLRYKHVLFDLDGTIYDSLNAEMEALSTVINRYRPGSNETCESMMRFSGTTGEGVAQALAIPPDDFKDIADDWCRELILRLDTIKMFDGMGSAIKCLKSLGCKLGVITSRARGTMMDETDLGSAEPLELRPYIDITIAAGDAKRNKPYPDPILEYMRRTGATCQEILFVGDTPEDLECAQEAGVDFGLAMWGTRMQGAVRCAHHFCNPWQIVHAATAVCDHEIQWFKWAREIQAIGQTGLAYTDNVFDIERWNRLRDIACEMMQARVGLPFELVKEAFAFDKGYCTPKLDTRAAIFNERGEILMVQEKRRGVWDLPGGWCDESESIFSNAVKEAREEAMMEVTPVKLIAILDADCRNPASFPYTVLRCFVECAPGSWHFSPTTETQDCRFFDKEHLPLKNLRIHVNNHQQLLMCFEAHQNKNWVPIVD